MSTRLTLPVSSACRAAIMTGPDIVSQCAPASPGASVRRPVTKATSVAKLVLGIFMAAPTCFAVALQSMRKIEQHNGSGK